MPIDPTKAHVAKIVCDQFFLGKGTPRQTLIRLVKDGFVLDKMSEQSLLRSEDNRMLFFPTLGTFALLSDDDPRLADARLGTLQVLHTLHNLYEVDDPPLRNYTAEQLIEAVRKRYPVIDEKMVRLGLYLVVPPGFIAVQGYSHTDDRLGIKSLTISERVMVIDSPEAAWQEVITSLRRNAELPPAHQPVIPLDTPPTIRTQRMISSEKRHWLPKGWSGGKSLGEGGQGWTYLVRRSGEDDGAWFVFKRLKNAKRAERFESEIKALRGISHPGILKIEDNGTHDGMPFYVAEYCQNGDLSNRNLEAITLLEKLMLFRQICCAVGAAHAKKIIHRDLKPSNILMRGDGSTVVGDFGLCLDLGTIDRLTETHEAVGPRNFMAPELEDGRQDETTPAADVYSLGKVLYFLLSGKSFAREKHRESLYDLTRPESLTPERGMEFVYDLLDMTIVQRPEQRLQDAAAVVSSLDLVIRKIVMNAHVLDPAVKQPCLYCVEGEYRPLGQGDKFRYSLICFRCGNMQQFSAEHNGWKNWWMPK